MVGSIGLFSLDQPLRRPQLRSPRLCDRRHLRCPIDRDAGIRVTIVDHRATVAWHSCARPIDLRRVTGPGDALRRREPWASMPNSGEWWLTVVAGRSANSSSQARASKRLRAAAPDLTRRWRDVEVRGGRVPVLGDAVPRCDVLAEEVAAGENTQALHSRLAAPATWRDTASAPAQVTINIGPAPDCATATMILHHTPVRHYGYYGPDWFINGAFVGAGPDSSPLFPRTYRQLLFATRPREHCRAWAIGDSPSGIPSAWRTVVTRYMTSASHGR